MPYRVLEDYPRRPHLEFFRGRVSPFYSLTFDLDATRLRERLAAGSLPVYAGFCWAFHRALLRVPAFRVRLVGEDVVLWELLRIGLTVPAPGRTFSFATLDWDADAERFLARATEVLARASERIDLAGGGADFAYYTAAPKVPFTSLTHAPHPDPEAGQPQIAFGRFAARDGRLSVPVGIQVNHLYVDGADLGDLYEAAQESFDSAF
jgi:chloramphenicol O-acetyltransferase type A